MEVISDAAPAGSKKNKITILVSGSGTNLQRILEAVASGEIPNSEIVKVIADRECYGLVRAEKGNIPAALIKKDKQFSQNLAEQIPEDTDLIVLAGFLSILNEALCHKFQGKIINIHPALLPKYGGKGMWGPHVHQAVLQAKEKKSGATVHFVTHQIDEGEIILQKSFEITETDTLETLQEKVHEIEQEIFPAAIKIFLERKTGEKRSHEVAD